MLAFKFGITGRVYVTSYNLKFCYKIFLTYPTFFTEIFDLFAHNINVAIFRFSGFHMNAPAFLFTFHLSPHLTYYAASDLGARVSRRFLDAAEDEQVEILEAFNNGFAAKVGRGIDIMYMHGKNPRTGEISPLITYYFDKIEQTVPYDAAAPDDCVDDAIALTGDWDVTGIAMAKSFASALGKKTNENGTKMYPGLSWGGDPKEVNGVPSSVNSAEECVNAC